MAVAAVRQNGRSEGAFRVAEQIYALIGLLLMIDALGLFFTGFTRPQTVDRLASAQEGNLGMQVFGTLLYLGALLALLPRYGQVIALIGRNKLLFLFLLVIAVSFSWSVLPQASLRRSLALVGTTFFAIWLALTFSPRELLRLLGLALGLAAVASLLLILFRPQLGIGADGIWIGVWGHKNNMGRIMVLGMLVLWLCAEIDTGQRKPWIFAGLLLCALLVAMSQSATSWIVAMCLVVSLPMLASLRQSSTTPLSIRLCLILTVGVGGLLLLVVQYYDLGLTLLGRDATLTGRTTIWGLAIDEGSKEPWLGYGYRAFWPYAYWLVHNYGHGHNSFLDLWLELGLVGLGIFLATFVLLVYRAFRRLTETRDPMGRWYALFLIYIFLFSITSQVFPDHGTIAWVLYMANHLYLSPVAAQTAPAAAQPAPAPSGARH